jgi:hypothetical protein
VAALLALLTIALVLGGCAETTTNGGGGETDASGDSSKQDGCGSKATEDCTPKVSGRKSVQVDTLRWRVRGAESATTLGDVSTGLGEEADGTFVVVKLSVKNGKDESVTLTDQVTQLQIGEKRYDPDTEGTVAAIGAGEDPFFLEDVGPDSTAKGTVVFDIPKSALKKEMDMRFNELGFGETHGFIRINP